MRGADKSTLGAMLAEDVGCPFIELGRQIEKFAGCSVGGIQNLCGQNACRRCERRALEEAGRICPEVVIATPGGIVSDPATFNLRLAHCTTVGLQPAPEDHMRRVMAQGAPGRWPPAAGRHVPGTAPGGARRAADARADPRHQSAALG